MLRIVVPGTPVAKGRPRATKMGRHIRLYTPAKTIAAERTVRDCAIEQIGSPVLVGPLEVRMVCSFGYPKSWSKAMKQQADAGLVPHVSKPDADNLFKIVDGLNGVVWQDDSQIVRLSVEKRYAVVAETVIEVFEVGVVGKRGPEK